jgi:signal transduction histidine kinase
MLDIQRCLTVRSWPGRVLLLLWGLLQISEAGAGILYGVAVRRDPGGTATIDSISADPGGFHPLDHGLSAGYTRAVHWLRFVVQRSPGKTGELWLEVQPPFLDDLRLFEPVDEACGLFREHRAGDRLPFAAREVPYRAFVFRLDPPDARAHTYFLRLQTTSTSLMTLRLWRPGEFHAAAAKEAGFLGFYYGAMIVAALFNLIYWFWLRHALYLCYVLYLVVLTLQFLGFNGLVAQYLLPESPAISDAWLSISVFVSSSTAGLFFFHVLSIKRRDFWLYRLFQVQIAVPAVLSLSPITGHFTEAAMLVNSLNMITLAAGSGHAFRQFLGGVPGGAFLAFSLLLCLLGFSIGILTLLGVVPAVLWAIHGVQLASIGHVLMMNLAVSARMRAIDRARREAVLLVDAAEIEAERERNFRYRQSRFLGMLSHELKTPLSVIDSAVQSLQQLPGGEHPDVERRHHRIRKAVKRIDGLIGQCLTQDRIDDSGLIVRRQPMDLAWLVRAVVEDKFEDKVRIAIEAPGDLLMEGDEVLLRIAILNLIDNALKYSPVATLVHVAVHEAFLEGKSGAAIDVADSGPGISASLAERIFEPFVRGDQQGYIAGAGLGLYLVRRIIEMHRGRITLVEQSRGACFRIWLPIEGEATP